MGENKAWKEGPEQNEGGSVWDFKSDGRKRPHTKKAVGEGGSHAEVRSCISGRGFSSERQESYLVGLDHRGDTF